MNGREFSAENYDQAITYANNILTDANNIQSVFNSIDRALNSLIGKDWDSSGAGMTEDEYRALRQNYDVFYNLVVRDHEHINKTIASYREADAQGGNVTSNI